MKALLVIDIQNGILSWEGVKVLAADELLATVNGLIARARDIGAPIIFFQHEDEWLVPGSESFAIVDDLDRRPQTDASFVKRHSSAFYDTPLSEKLDELGVDGIVVCGLQTELCVDSTVRHAYTLGLPVTLVGDAHSTYDSEILSAEQIIAHHNAVLSTYATVVKAAAVRF